MVTTSSHDQLTSELRDLIQRAGVSASLDTLQPSDSSLSEADLLRVWDTGLPLAMIAAARHPSAHLAVTARISTATGGSVGCNGPAPLDHVEAAVSGQELGRTTSYDESVPEYALWVLAIHGKDELASAIEEICWAADVRYLAEWGQEVVTWLERPQAERRRVLDEKRRAQGEHLRSMKAAQADRVRALAEVRAKRLQGAVDKIRRGLTPSGPEKLDKRIASHIQAAATIVTKKPEAAVRELVEAWRLSSNGEIGDIVRRWARKRVGKLDPKPSRAEAIALWKQVTPNASAEALWSALPSLTVGGSPSAKKRLRSVLKRKVDPVIIGTLVDLLADLPFHSIESKPFWTMLFKVLTESGDTKTLAAVRKIAASDHVKSIGSVMREHFERALGELVILLEARIGVAARPVPRALKLKLARVERELATTAAPAAAPRPAAAKARR